jgi:hypothetical protein
VNGWIHALVVSRRRRGVQPDLGGVAAPGAVIVVPRDDYTCSSIGVFPVPKGVGAARRAGAGTDPAVWGPAPANRRIRLPRQDREAMAAGQSFAGFRGGNRIQDAAVQVMLMGASNTTMTRGPGVLLHPPQRFRLFNGRLSSLRRWYGRRAPVTLIPRPLAVSRYRRSRSLSRSDSSAWSRPES